MYTGISLDQAPPEDIPLRFFLSAPLFGILAGVLLIFGGGDLFVSNWSMETIALTHLFTLGWLAMIMMGAFYQMVPVLVGGAVPFIYAARGVHAIFSAGILLMVLGYYRLSPLLMMAASALLLLPLLFFILQIMIALFRVKGDRSTVVAMRLSVLSLAATVIFGVYFLGAHAEIWPFPENRVLMTVTHLSLGLFGWVGGLIMGVGFHVIPMFYMTPVFPPKKASLILWCYFVSLLLLPAALLLDAGSVAILLAGLPGLAAFLIFGKTIMEIMNKRRRKIVDTTLRSWQVGLILLFISLIAFIGVLFVDHEATAFLFGIVYILGFALTITTGMLYKIVPFLIWFHRFSLHVGKVPVPHLKQISPDKAASRQLYLFWASLVLLLVGVLTGLDAVVRLSGVVFSSASVMLFYNMLKMTRMKAPEAPEEVNPLT